MKIYTYRSGHMTLKRVLSIALSLLVLVQMTPAAFVIEKVEAAVGTVTVSTINGSGTGPYTVSGSWEPVGNQPCWNSGQGGSFRYFLNVFEDMNANGEFDSGTDLVLQALNPAPCNGDYEGSVSNDDNNLGGGWPASGQSFSPTNFNLAEGSHSICSALLHVNNQGGDVVDSDCLDNAVIVPPADVCPDDDGLQTEGPCTSEDVCPNDAGIQTDPNDCTPQDLCPNDIGLQTTTPCPSEDVCPNDVGIQTNPDDCTPSGPTDVCPNVAGDQATGPCADQVCTDAGNIWNTSTQTCDTPSVPDANLSITKSVDDSTPNEGQTLAYSLSVTNSGPDNATNVVVADVLPAGLTFVSASSTVGTYASSTGDWTVGALANGASALLDITVTVNSSTAGQTITNSASVDGSENDSVAENNNASASAVVNTPDQGSQRFTLDVTITGDGTGSVTGNGIDCVSGEASGDCQETYDAGTIVNITATANEGSNFDNSWTIGGGTCTGNNTPCSVTINSNVSLSAHFGLNQTTTTSGGGGGGSHRGGGIVLGINNDEPQGQVLGATFEPGLPNTGNGPLNSGETNALAIIFAGMIALVGLNLASFKALKLETKSK
jgi:uncharacterized repeat protein (TIGR01451 family)